MTSSRKYFISLVLVIFWVAIQASPARADEWEMRLTVYASNAYNKLSMGQKNGASDGVDASYDVPALLNGDIKAYFVQGGSAYWRDIKSASGSSKKWTIRVESNKGRAIQVKWDPRQLPSGKTFTLKDEPASRDVSLRSGTSYSYVSDGLKDLVIELESE